MTALGHRNDSKEMFDKEINQFLKRHDYVAAEPRAALIDMDGTLYDSMPSHARAWKRMTDEIGMNIDEDEFYLHEGRTGAGTIDILFVREWGRHATEEEIRELYARKTRYFNEMKSVEPMPGAFRVLDFLRKVGMRRVLVTGSGQASLLERVNADFDNAFEPGMTVTARDVVHGKPAPDPFLLAMKRADVSPAQSIVIENAPLGVQAGDAAGAFTIGVTTGPIPGRVLKEAGAAIVFPSMDVLADELPMLLWALGTRGRNLN